MDLCVPRHELVNVPIACASPNCNPGRATLSNELNSAQVVEAR